jgi:hypothetical protein
MAKRHTGHTKKGLPGLIRITKRTRAGKGFERVWLYKGQEYKTLREIRLSGR